jgi:hypothetical protein
VTQAEFITVASLTKPMLHKMLKGVSFQKAMDLRYEIQKGLTAYAKTRGSQGSNIDAVQQGALDVLHNIESWCRQAYYSRRLPEILVQEGSLIYRGKKEAKTLVRQEWEKLAAERAY